jgi:hypothetical protein
MNGEGITLTMETRETYAAAYATLFPLILEGLGDPRRSTWLRFDAETRWEPCPLAVNSREPIIKEVNYRPYGLLKDRIQLEVCGDSGSVDQGRSVFRLANGESSVVSLGHPRRLGLEWSPPFASRTYPAVLDARLDPLDGDLGLKLSAQLRVGCFWSSMSSGIAIAPSNGPKTADHWLEESMKLMQQSFLWKRLLGGQKPLDRLKQAFLAVESDAAECVGQKGNCISFLRDTVDTYRVTDATQPQNGSVRMSSRKTDRGSVFSISDRLQCLQAVLQASKSFRSEVLLQVNPGNDKGIAGAFPYTPKPAVKGQEMLAEKELEDRIKDYENRSREYFTRSELFDEWCWRTVRDAEDEPTNVAILAGLWLTLAHTRGGKPDQKSMMGHMKSLSSTADCVRILFRVAWKSSEWGAIDEEVIEMFPYGIRMVSEWPSLPGSAGEE